MKPEETGWWTEFFDDFRPAFGIIDKKTTNAEVKYLIAKLKLKPGSTFLDCPCGIGRVSIPLCQKGINVTGVDITKSYLEELQNKVIRNKLSIKTMHSDMRKINFDSQFDAGGNLWTSFGFFKEESNNFLVLKKMYKALKPGGKFVLHVINRDWLIANYVPKGWFNIGDLKIVEDRSFDFRTSINHCIWYFIKGGQEKSFNVTIRAYSFHELVSMFEKVGFVDIEGYGSIKDEPISQQNRMMWVFGTKAK